MEYYNLEIAGLKRKLPVVAISPRVRVASFNLLGDKEMVEVLAKKMAKQLKNLDFDYLVGPEVKVLPLLHELSKILKKQRYIVCRKQIHGYMISPIVTKIKPSLVIDGNDAKLLKGKRVVLVDDVVSSGRTMRIMDDLMRLVGARIVAHVAIFKQGNRDEKELDSLIYLGKLPTF